MLKPRVFILALFAMFSTSAWAQDLRVCPNVQVGVYDDGATLAPAIYSDCSLETVYGSGYHLTMRFNGTSVRWNGFYPDGFDPKPVGDVPFGKWDELDIVSEDMGPDYTGICNDMAASIPTDSSTAPTADGSVYCARLSNVEGHQLWLRGTVDVAGNTWKDPIVLTNKPGVGTPYSPKATVPVPVLPLWGLLSMAGLIGLFGFRKLRA